jgi:hypothetical protein
MSLCPLTTKTRRRWLPVLGALGIVLLSARPAAADLIVSAEKVAGIGVGSTNNALQVNLTNTGPGAIVIGSFSFELSVKSALITFTGVDTSTKSPYIFDGKSLFGPNIGTSPPGQVMDASDLFAVMNSGATLGSGTTVGLGDVRFNVSGSAVPGSFFDVFVSLDPSTTLADALGTPIPINSFQNGSITLAGRLAVPEPSSIVLVGCFLATGLAGCARRRWLRGQTVLRTPTAG